MKFLNLRCGEEYRPRKHIKKLLFGARVQADILSHSYEYCCKGRLLKIIDRTFRGGGGI